MASFVKQNRNELQLRAAFDQHNNDSVSIMQCFELPLLSRSEPKPVMFGGVTHFGAELTQGAACLGMLKRLMAHVEACYYGSRVKRT